CLPERLMRQERLTAPARDAFAPDLRDHDGGVDDAHYRLPASLVGTMCPLAMVREPRRHHSVRSLQVRDSALPEFARTHVSPAIRLQLHPRNRPVAMEQVWLRRRPLIFYALLACRASIYACRACNIMRRLWAIQ